MGFINWLTGKTSSPFEPTAEACIEHIQGFNVGFDAQGGEPEHQEGPTTRAYQQGVKAGQKAYQQVQANPEKYR